MGIRHKTLRRPALVYSYLERCNKKAVEEDVVVAILGGGMGGVLWKSTLAMAF